MGTLNDIVLVDGTNYPLAEYMNKFFAGLIRPEYSNTETITGTKELTDADYWLQVITPSGADRTVELAPEAASNHLTVIYNAGSTYNVAVKDDSGAITYKTLVPDEFTVFLPVYGEGWKIFGISYASSAEVLTGTETAKAVSPDTLNDVLTRIPLSGMMLNGKISLSVVSNDLVLAIKTWAGADPSASDPVYINIAGTVRTISAATSCTLPDGTNWFNAGSAELATKEIDYFAYAIWDSNSSVVAVAPARIPFGRLVSDFSATTTNEKHLGNYANYTTTDDVCVIGRFAATLSAGAGYTWTVPTFTSVNLILHPIYETRILDFVPQWTGLSVGNGTLTGKYQRIGRQTHYQVRLEWGSSTSISGDVRVSTPTTMNHAANQYENLGACSFVDAGTALYVGVVVAGYTSADANLLTLRCMNASATYAYYAYLSSSVPMTWTISDIIDVVGRYWN